MHIVCVRALFQFFFNDTATTEIYTLSLHDALPISACLWSSEWSPSWRSSSSTRSSSERNAAPSGSGRRLWSRSGPPGGRSGEHTSELQSRQYLVCRLLLEKKKYSTCSTRCPTLRDS